jgi:phosphoglycerate-specific signal transduction histidine kinase
MRDFGLESSDEYWVRRSSEVIRTMRSLLTKAPFELKSLDLNDVARETAAFLAMLAVAQKVELTRLITQNALPILGDHIQLQQVILNFVANGIFAMKDTPIASSAFGLRASRSLPSYPYWIADRAFPKTN